jgi:hypothetical protein
MHLNVNWISLFRSFRDIQGSFQLLLPGTRCVMITKVVMVQGVAPSLALLTQIVMDGVACVIEMVQIIVIMDFAECRRGSCTPCNGY